ncbi:hypothetical protein [Brachyspira pulli]|uniref:hypothetical protein n=1 Tax=Brachyspira pulli TaxID=310721 RepID=UPI003006FB7C
MTNKMKLYFLKDITNTGIYHIYEVIDYKIINNNVTNYTINNYPLCGDDDSYIDSKEKVGFFYNENGIIILIKNILYGKKNEFRLCENCMRTIIAEKQDRLF